MATKSRPAKKNAERMIQLRVKNIITRRAKSDGRKVKVGQAGKHLVMFAPDSFGGCWFSITTDQIY